MGASHEELKEQQDAEELLQLKKEFFVYDNELLDKDFLLIYPDISSKHLSKLEKKEQLILNKLKTIEIKFRKEHFAHLVGIKKNGKPILAKQFYEDLKKDRIKRKDYETTIFSEMKSDVFNKLPHIFRQMSIVGNYNHTKPQFLADKIVGGTKKIPEIVLGLRNINEDRNEYIPCSILKEQTSNLILKDSERKIIFVFSKNKEEKQYKNLIFIRKHFTYHSEYNNSLFTYLK